VKIRALKSNKGMVLVAVGVVLLILTLLGFSMLSVANSEIILTQKDVNKTKAFYLAEAGVAVLAARLSAGNYATIEETALGEGSYRVDFTTTGSEPCAVATGTAVGATERIQVTLSFLAPPYECGMYAGGLGGPWTLILSGTGDPCSVYSWGQEVGNYGGRDIINGNIFVDGNVAMYQQSSVNPALYPNTYDLHGDVNSTGSIDRYDSATIAGREIEGSADMHPPDLVAMNYAVNNTHNVSQIFSDAHVTQGTLPAGNELRNVFQINPSNMSAECASTSGNDYFFTPSTGIVEGNWKTASTPLHAGNNRIYYVDGDVWVHSKSTYGFKVDGKVTIVATGDIHICDNLAYANSNKDMLGLVALGKYDGSGQRTSGGNIYFGDPVYGTLYTCSAMMFAANNFLYNTKAIGTYSAEPESGFIVNGSMTALNQVSIERDWYTSAFGVRRPANYNPSTNQWYDSGTGVALTSAQVDTMKHYQMIVNYDDRVRSQSTQPLGLPRGTGFIFCGLTNWKEL
jgi:hypothetical protein